MSPVSVMASSSSVLCEDQLQCSICLDVFTDPVSTPCGHNFCMFCLKEFWDSSSHCQCPMCKMEFPKRPELCVNTFISALAAPFKKSVQEKSSSAADPLPSKPKKVLCDSCTEEKLEALKSCLYCGVSYCNTHLMLHKTTPKLMKHKLMEPVENLEDYICQKHERPLELFCRDDQTCVCQFCTEGDHKTHSTVPIEEAAEEKKIYPSLCSPPHTQDWTDVTITSHLSVETLRRNLSQLQQTLSEEMEKLVDVTLDPDTAHPGLILSDDMKEFTCGDKKQKLPDNPERFDCCACVLGKEGFSSGRFYYEVQVRGKINWDLGVVRESINRKGKITASPENGYWCVCLRNKTEYKALDSPSVSLSLKQAPQKVGVFVDCEEGLISFYDVDAKSHIYSFTGLSFTGKLYPFFGPCTNDGGKNSAPLIICPVSQI
ncbi:hypothetical protein PGIGA_G00198500 [Pangasianodon gigas]|uniref:Uncharacterized protein n=1 Tax=Pangasianodon gigas TaxID=30993 RepID=A0ACC5WD71_PANGG|nr:hypothetical protein [Pangasianodon gigas]